MADDDIPFVPAPPPGLPLVIEDQRPRPSLARSDTTAAFVSQLLAERDRLPVQRPRRTTSVEGALGAYSEGARNTTLRMPQGYRKTVVA